MQAIHSKYIPATNHKGSRIKATCERGSITIPYPYELEVDSAHRLAVRKLLWSFLEEDHKRNQTPPEQNSWAREFASGTLPNGTMVHVLL